MWLCKECGYSNEGRNICKQCGMPKEQSEKTENTNASDVPHDMTLYEINKELKKMHRYFKPMLAQYKEYNYCNQRLDFLSKKGDLPLWVLIFGIVLCSVSLFLIIMTILVLFKRYNGLLIWWGMFLGLGIYCVTKYTQNITENRKQIRKFQSREIELAKELTGYFREYGQSLIEGEYSDPRIIEKLLQIIDSGRAESVEKAIDRLFFEAGKTKEQNRDYLDIVSGRQKEYGEADVMVFCSAEFFGAYNSTHQ